MSKHQHDKDAKPWASGSTLRGPWTDNPREISLMHWPNSAPDYKWPRLYASVWIAPFRLIAATAFHCGYALGLICSLVRRGPAPVLVIRTDGIGDALLFEPALETLAQTLSPHPIHLWAPKATLEVMSAVPVIDRRFVIPRGFRHGNLNYFRSPLWRIRMGFRMGVCVYDKVVYPADSPEPLGNWLFASVRAVERWINYGDTDNQFEWQRQRAQQKASFVIDKRPGSAHELLRNAYLATQWSGKLKVRKPKVHLTDRARDRADRQIELWKPRFRAVGAAELIGVVSQGASVINQYPMGKWLQTMKMLWNDRRALPALIGGPNDTYYLDRIATGLQYTGVPFVRVRRPRSVLDTTALLARLDGVISVDTGLAHLAVAQQIPTVVLVGGGHPGRFFPWPRAAHHVVLNVQMPCERCRNKCSQAEPLCITQITPGDIVAAYVGLKTGNTPLQLFPTWTSPLQATG
jgi:ADP-heptose:LPS heptosyltransferase